MNLRSTIGWYEIAGGTVGVALTAYAALRGTALPGENVRVAIAPFTALVLAGWRLRRGGPRSRWPSIAMQLVQLFFFSAAGYGWKFTGGLLVSVSAVESQLKLFAGLDASFITAWHAVGQPFVVGLNVVPLVLLVLLARLNEADAAVPKQAAPASAA